MVEYKKRKREVLIDIFRNTDGFCKNEESLQESIKDSMRGTKVYIENFKAIRKFKYNEPCKVVINSNRTLKEARKILTDPVEIQKLTKTKLYRPHGCPNCKNSGYLGRLAVLEILVINNEIRKMIAQRAHDVELEDYAIKQGMKTLKMACLRHILEGNTSIEEQVRILGLAGEQ